MSLETFIRRMPKVELHVHLEGSIRPETLLILAERNNVSIPAQSVEELRDWYQFTDFAHFIEIYKAICNCLRTPDDFELITAEFLRDRAEQNIRYSEVIFTPYTHHEHVAMDDQLTAINRACRLAEADWGVTIGLVPDISRGVRPVDHSLLVADWAIRNRDNGVIALGLGGPEIDNPPELFAEAFDRIHAAGLPSMPHAGETVGPESIWGAIKTLRAVRIGHGVRCLEDPELVAYLRESQIPLDVSPTSNVCLGVAPSLAEHPLPQLIEEGLSVTLNSDDPPMFGATLTDEYLHLARTFGFDLERIKQLTLNGIRVSLLPEEARRSLENEFETHFTQLQNELKL
ncbi:MAG: adenosine deaminase [Chloroflexi bacterium]|nr:adenosine deaminase [Chloroflexota bacterium]